MPKPEINPKVLFASSDPELLDLYGRVLGQADQVSPEERVIIGSIISDGYKLGPHDVRLVEAQIVASAINERLARMPDLLGASALEGIAVKPGRDVDWDAQA